MRKIVCKSVNVGTAAGVERCKNDQILDRKSRKIAVFTVFNRLLLTTMLTDFDEIFNMYIAGVHLPNA